jgi:serine/threonine protein kinase
MLSSFDFKPGEPTWTAFQNRAIDDAFRIRDFLGGDEKSAAFTARPLGDPETNAVIRLYRANDDSAAERQIGLWLRAEELRHPNLVRILGAGRIADGANTFIYVALEPADEKLASVLMERRLEPDEAAEIFKSMTSALTRLHEKGYVHGAVSPDQVFAIGDSIKLSAENIRPIGSHDDLFADPPRFVAPESDGLNATAAADVWCLGATLYQCLTQETPDGTEFHHTTLPEPHRSIVRRALDPDAEARATLEEVVELERGKKSAASAVATASAPVATPPDEPAVTVPDPPAAAEITPKPVAPPPPPPPVVPPKPESLRVPTLGKRDEPALKQQGVPMWAYGAGAIVIILALILLLRPKHPAQQSAEPAGTTAPAAHEKTLPPASEAPGSATRGNPPAPARSQVKPSPAGRPQVPVQSGTAGGSVWRVIVYTYNSRADAQKRAETINQKHPNLKAEVFSPSGNGGSYLVVVGGGMTRDQAKRFRQTALGAGMPRDSYLQNFTH